MVRSIAITVAVVAAIAAGSTLSSPALARGMGGMGSMGHAGFGGMGHAGFGGMGHAGFGGMGHAGFGGVGHPGVVHMGGFAHPGFARPGFGRPFAFRDRFAFRHRFFGPRFVFIGAPIAAYDSCLERVWTGWGWRWVNVCY